MKKIVLYLLIFSILVLGCIPAMAQEEITVYLNNEKLVFDVAPLVVKERVLVPMRLIFEKLGATVQWYPETNSATVTTGYKGLSFSIGSPLMQNQWRTIELDVPVMAKDGRTLVPLRAISEAFGSTVKWDDESKSVIIYSEDFVDFSKEKPTQETVEVSDATELLNAIGSNKRIILTKDYYNLSNAGEVNNEYVEKETNFEGSFSGQYTIKNVVNMSIEGNAEIATDEINSHVLYFKNCGKITLSGLTVGHTEPADSYQCEGAVTRFDYCDTVNIENCNLYGCGAVGVYGLKAKNLLITNSKIYDCTFSGIWLTENSEAQVVKTEIFNCNLLSGFLRIDSSKIVLDNCNIHHITCDNQVTFVDTLSYADAPSEVIINNTVFENNTFFDIADSNTKISFNKCSFNYNNANIYIKDSIFSDCTLTLEKQ